MEAKKYSGGSTSASGAATLPMQKVRGIMKSNERVAVVSTEAAHVMTKAAEHFIGWITTKAMANKDNPDQLEFATDLRPKWEHLGLQPPKGAKPSAKSVLSSNSNSSKPKNSRPKSEVHPKKRSKPKEKVDAFGNAIDGDHEGNKPSSVSKPRARKSDGEGGNSQKRSKKDDNERDIARHNGIGGLLDDDEDSADRRAVENLIEAARGNMGGEVSAATRTEKAEKPARKRSSGGSRAKPAAKGVASNGNGGEGGGVYHAGSPLRESGAASLLGSLGFGNLQQLPLLPQLQQLQEYHELRKRMEQQAKVKNEASALETQRQLQQRVQQAQQALLAQTTQRLVQQAVQQAAQRMQQNGGGAPSAQALQAAQAGAAASALMFPGLQQNGNGGVSMPEPQQQVGGFPAGFPLHAGLAQLLAMPAMSMPQGFNATQAQLVALLGAAAAAAQAAQAQNAAAANASTANALCSPTAVGAGGMAASAAAGAAETPPRPPAAQ